MKYIGNKTRLIDFIKETLEKENIDYKNCNVIDLFAGTGSVSNFFLKNGCNVISCDNMTYSIAEQYRINYFLEEPKFNELQNIVGGNTLEDVLNYLNDLKEFDGYFFQNYAPHGKFKRQYFTDENAKKIDAIEKELDNFQKLLAYDKIMFLKGILMCAADKVSNTSGTYGAYLKIWRSMALKKIILEKPSYSSNGKIEIIKDDVMNIIKQYKDFDIIYLDPPYNKRQYASNFHVLENIVVNDESILKGKTGLRDYSKQKSLYCMSREVKNEFEKLVNNMSSNYIIMSYSTEGLLKENDIYDILTKKGKVIIYRNKYRRFKTNSWTRDGKTTNLEELLFICKCDRR